MEDPQQIKKRLMNEGFTEKEIEEVVDAFVASRHPPFEKVENILSKELLSKCIKKVRQIKDIVE